MSEEGTRLQKFLAGRGVASRRGAAELVGAGRVRVNGEAILEPGHRIDPQCDRVEVDGRPVPRARERLRTVLLNKPRGCVCSASEHDGRTVLSLLRGVQERLVPVGRLDKNSEGLLLLSNDGDLILRLTHPRFEQEKTYRATVSGAVGTPALTILRSRLVIDGYRIRPAQVEVLKPGATAGRTVLQFVLREGRNRQIRRMCEAAGLTVHRLVRTRIRSLACGALRPGEWRDLTPAELRDLVR
jgi:pseudouridine synthase